MAAQPTRLGMVGCGGISHLHALAAQAIPDTLCFAACCDIREDAAKQWAKAYHCPAWYTDFEAMIKKEALDGVLLATWPNQHREQIERCLSAGAHNILCEKALTLTGQHAYEAWEMVRHADASLMEGFMYRHHPSIQKLDELLATGDLGPVDTVRAAFHAYDPETQPVKNETRDWRQRKECGGGIPYDFACYCVNACQHFAGALPVRVYCRGDISEKYDTINRMFGTIEYENGCVGIIESSKKGSWNHEVQITAAHSILRLPIAWSNYESLDITRTWCVKWGYPEMGTYRVTKANAYQLQLENFAAVIRGQAEPGMPLVESVVNAYTTEALVKSASEKRPVEIDLPDPISQRWK